MARTRTGRKQQAKSNGVRDHGPRERWQHGDETLVEATEEAGGRRVVVLTQDALDRYYRRGQLAPAAAENQRLYDAGVRLRRDFHRAGLTPDVVARYSDLVSGGSVQGFMALREDAYRAWRAAIRAVGPVAAGEVVAVCCQGAPVGKGARMEILRRGLAVLAQHYGY
ncbi:MAG: DUF6456 domain-containing protein [Alphaproteobacteria bacterium]|nr:DUF6456 domain-containing protein [Alphaproteobacteria bacterium]